jgi:AraC family transcriptional regulator
MDNAVQFVETIDADLWSATAAAAIGDPCEALPEQVFSSSRGRPWRGLAVWHQVGPPGDLYIPRVSAHTVLVRRAGPTDLVQRQGPTILRRRWLPGEAIIVPSGVPTFWHSESSRDNIHVDLDPAWLQRMVGNGEVRLRSCFGQHDQVLSGLASALFASLHNNSSLQPSFADGIAQSLAAHLLEHYSQPDPGRHSVAALTRRELDLITAVVRRDLQQPWPVQRMADVVGLSSFHFSRAFKAASGQSPHAYVTSLRMGEALRLVRSTSRPIFDIALDTGYASAAHFSQTFRRHWGVTPLMARTSERATARQMAQDPGSFATCIAEQECANDSKRFLSTNPRHR